MPLSEDVKMDVLRHLGYEVQGLYQLSPAGGSNAYGNAGFRMFGAYGDLLFKANWIRPIEEAKITGLATGWISLSGQEPNPGDTLTVRLSAPSVLSSPIDATVTIPARNIGVPYSLNNLAQALATAFGSQTAFVAAGFQALADYGQNPLSQTQKVAVPICSINGPPGLNSFTLAVTNMTGLIAPYVTPIATPVAPYAQFRLAGQQNQIFGFVPILNWLEGAHAGEAIFLSAIEANGTKFRADVLDQREHQLAVWQKKLALFLRVPIRHDVQDRPSVGW